MNRERIIHTRRDFDILPRKNYTVCTPIKCTHGAVIVNNQANIVCLQQIYENNQSPICAAGPSPSLVAASSPVSAFTVSHLTIPSHSASEVASLRTEALKKFYHYCHRELAPKSEYIDPQNHKNYYEVSTRPIFDRAQIRLQLLSHCRV